MTLSDKKVYQEHSTEISYIPAYRERWSENQPVLKNILFTRSLSVDEEKGKVCQ